MDNDQLVGSMRDLTVAAMKSQRVDPVESGADPFILVPSDYKVHDLERTLLEPTRKRGAFVVHDAETFIRMVGEQVTPGTRVFGDHQAAVFVAVLNDHADEDGAPGWRDHTVTFACPTTKEWKTWQSKDGQRMSQADFAQFIEDNSLECLTPDAATMIELARSLELRKSVNFASSIRLDNGLNELTFEERGDATAGKGKLVVPESFSLAMQVLQNGARYQIDARLRYRMNEGKLSMWYDLLRPHKVLEAAVNDVWVQIENGLATKIYRGVAGAGQSRG